MFVLVAVVALLATSATAFNYSNATLAKSYPGQPGYPNQVAWDALREATGGRLHKCPTTGSIAVHCGDVSLQSDYILLAQNAAEIAEGLKFATKNNLRVTIRNTGHDFMARHSGLGSFTIVTTNIKGNKWMKSWTPTAGSPEFIAKQKKLNQSAIEISAGNSFYDIYLELLLRGQIVVHGADPSVGAAGGWTQGGGHGPYSNRYGLGCDNVLEFEVVLTNGSIVIANEESHRDLFWAMRGGGGSTFGVASRTTMKTFPTPTMNNILINISYGKTGYEGYLDAMAYFFAMSPNFTDFGLSGYPVYSNKSYLASLTAPDRSTDEIKSFFAPIAARMESYGAKVFTMQGPSLVGQLSPLLGIWNGQDPQNRILGELPAQLPDGTPLQIPDILGDLHRKRKRNQELARQRLRLSRRQIVNMQPLHQTPIIDYASRLLARRKLNEANMPAIRKMLSDVRGYLLPYPNAGGAVSRKLDVGLNPAWRDTAMHLIAVSYDLAHNVKVMDPLSVNHGAYLNEAYDSEENWKQTFFGPQEHYDRLLAVKHKYDPTNTLWCFPCVGGDVFVRQKGKLYHTTSP